MARGLGSETGAPLADPIQLQLLDEALALSRSVDGRAVAAVLKMPQPDVYVGTLAKPVPELTDIQRITFDPMQDYPQAWTSDSKSILFESNYSVKGGTAFHIYRQAVDGPAHTEPLVSDPMVQVLPQQSPDGKWILFGASRGGFRESPTSCTVCMRRARAGQGGPRRAAGRVPLPAVRQELRSA